LDLHSQKSPRTRLATHYPSKDGEASAGNKSRTIASSRKYADEGAIAENQAGELSPAGNKKKHCKHVFVI
jgi:hypothetical protein